MKINKLYLPAMLCVALIVSNCGGDNKPKALTYEETLKAAVNNYANIVVANYEDALADAKALKTAVNTLVTTPSKANLEAAKKVWLKSRESYGQSEAFRLYGGPIDDADGPEGQLNAWPLDESYIDYVKGVTTSAEGVAGTNNASNIINTPANFPTINKEVIAGLNEQGGETNVSTGYHAIEFLLWGQDVSPGPGGGKRPYTDYVTGTGGTHANQARRGLYLKTAADLIVDDLNGLLNEWKPNGAYRKTFTSSAQLTKSLEKILAGIGKLSKGELAGERMYVAWDLRSKEDEHSCFSDNTHRDIVANAVGIRNVYLGTYKRTDGTTVSGSGVKDLVNFKNETLATELEKLMNQNVKYAEAIQAPFDQEFLKEPGRTRIQTSFRSLRKQGDKIAEAAALFGFKLDPSKID